MTKNSLLIAMAAGWMFGASPAALAEERVHVVTHCVKPLRRSIVVPNLSGSPFAKTKWNKLHKNLRQIGSITLIYKWDKEDASDATPDILVEEDGKVEVLSKAGIKLQLLNTIRNDDHFILATSENMDPYAGSVVSHYYFKLDEEGVGEVFWGSLHQNVYWQETSINRARCGKFKKGTKSPPK